MVRPEGLTNTSGRSGMALHDTRCQCPMLLAAALPLLLLLLADGPSPAAGRRAAGPASVLPPGGRPELLVEQIIGTLHGNRQPLGMHKERRSLQTQQADTGNSSGGSGARRALLAALAAHVDMPGTPSRGALDNATEWWLSFGQRNLEKASAHACPQWVPCRVHAWGAVNCSGGPWGHVPCPATAPPPFFAPHAAAWRQ
jgi:hypothetical protein